MKNIPVLTLELISTNHDKKIKTKKSLKFNSPVRVK